MDRRIEPIPPKRLTKERLDYLFSWFEKWVSEKCVMQFLELRAHIEALEAESPEPEKPDLAGFAEQMEKRHEQMIRGLELVKARMLDDLEKQVKAFGKDIAALEAENVEALAALGPEYAWPTFRWLLEQIKKKLPTKDIAVSVVADDDGHIGTTINLSESEFPHIICTKEHELRLWTTDEEAKVYPVPELLLEDFVKLVTSM